MADLIYTLTDSSGNQVTVNVRRDKRLTRFSRWAPQKDGSILLRVPTRLGKKEIGRQLDQLAVQLQKQDKLAERHTDSELQMRAEEINRKYFDNRIDWKAIRWVENMQHRLGSCTNGGPTDGHIRISARIKAWPDWVIDYVIAHELVHRLHSNHSQDFWKTLTESYPMSERARGFIQGVGFIKKLEYEEAG